MSATVEAPAETAARFGDLVRAALDRPLTADEAEAAFGEVVAGRASDVLLSALLAALRVRGASGEELAGAVRAVRRVMVTVPVESFDGLIDTCGTGGGTVKTFNISTAAAFVVAAAGARVAKHGNRSFSTRSGSADVLEALGIALDFPIEAAGEILEAAGVVFLFAPRHHPSIRHAGPVRQELATTTMMNVLGPVANPARVRRQVIGVADQSLLPLVAHALNLLGHEHALVVHGEAGMDEMSPVGRTAVMEVRGGEVRSWTFDADARLGWEDQGLEGLAGGSPDENAGIVRSVLSGEAPAIARRAVALNAGAALYVAGIAGTIEEGARRAEEAIASGAALDHLAHARTVTERFRTS